MKPLLLIRSTSPIQAVLQQRHIKQMTKGELTKRLIFNGWDHDTAVMIADMLQGLEVH